MVVKLFRPHPPVARNNRLPAGAGNAPEGRPFPSSTAAGTGQTHQLPSSMDFPSPSLSLSGRTTPTPPPAPRPPFREGKRKRGPPDWNLPLSWRVMWPIRGAAREKLKKNGRVLVSVSALSQYTPKSSHDRRRKCGPWSHENRNGTSCHLPQALGKAEKKGRKKNYRHGWLITVAHKYRHEEEAVSAR